jgi:bifunctional oligoribonuclease and PAP phosphatase NrnA
MVLHSAQEILKTLQSVVDPKIVITTHYKPDADAMGSSLGLKLFLESQGFKAQFISPTDYASFLKWMKGNDETIIFEYEPAKAKQITAEADFIFCLDFNHLSRINEYGIEVGNSKAKKILIDHHQYPQGFEDFAFWDDLASSTCELVYRFIHANNLDASIDADTAACLYTGIVTDTGSFRFASCSSETMRVAASLMDKGINHEEIFSAVYDSFSESRVKFIGYAISQKMEILKEFNTALITINKDELKTYGVVTGDTEGLVNYGLSIEGIKFAVLIIDRTKIVKMSFRSKGDFAANVFAMQHFNGGGHFHAAGGSSFENLDETISTFKNALNLYKGQLNG